MRQRPWSIILIAAFQWLTPVADILLNSWLSHVTPIGYIRAFQSATFLDQFQFYALTPIAGIAIYACRSWSFPTFIAIMSWNAWANFLAWRQSPHFAPLGVMLAVYALNVALVAYFLIPQVRAVYFDKKVRWWQNQPRYWVRFPARIKSQGTELGCELVNLSGGGAFVATTKALELGKEIDLRFSIFGVESAFSAEIVHAGTQSGSPGYGLRFLHDGASTRSIQRILLALRLLHVERTPDYLTWRNIRRSTYEFISWGKTALRTGQGIVPALPAKRSAAPAKPAAPDTERTDRAA